MRNTPCLYLFLGGLLLSSLMACNSKAPDATTAEAEAYARNNVTLDAYASSRNPPLTTVSLPSGLRYVISPPAPTTAKQVTLGEEIEMQYRQYYILTIPATQAVRDSTVDTTYATRSAFVPFFKQALIPGLEEGLLLLREGSNATLLMPARLAFGAQGSVGDAIPANVPVRIDIRLLRSRSETQQITEYIARRGLTPTDSTTTGLRVIKLKSNPTGDSIRTDATLNLRFNGGLLRSATAIDSTTGTLTRPYTVGQPVTSSIALLSTEGFRQGLAKLRVGERALFIFPSSLAYAAQGFIPAGTGAFLIPPNAPLRIDVEVVAR